jgi:hypothetical protein
MFVLEHLKYPMLVVGLSLFIFFGYHWIPAYLTEKNFNNMKAFGLFTAYGVAFLFLGALYHILDRYGG